MPKSIVCKEIVERAMPELPEVETVAAGLRQMFGDNKIKKVICHTKKLRYPLDQEKINLACSQGKIEEITRRGKYMIWKLQTQSTVIVHLGMSGRFCKVTSSTPLEAHDHVQFMLPKGMEIRYRDPRRFGLILPIIDGAWEQHPLLASLGAEPLIELNPKQLKKLAQTRSINIKKFIMDQKVIVGVGNIYASESLFLAKIHPLHKAAKMTLTQWKRLCQAIEKVLQDAIAAGGTTLADGGFSDVEGNFGQFAISLKVYGRKGEVCDICSREIEQITIGGRSSYFCPKCQKK